MSAPLRVSVLIPCYNHGAFLDEAVQSVLQQTVKDVELIVVDDGSTDPATRDLLTSYAPPRTKVVHTPNRGLAAARNLALSLARAPVICALDADDRLHPTFFEKALALLDADPALTFVSSWLRMFGDEDRLWVQHRCDLPALLAEDTVHTAALVRRQPVVEVGGWDGGMGVQGYEDWDLWISLLERGGRGHILQEVLFDYRRLGGSMSATCTQGEAHLQLMQYLFNKHAASYRAHLPEVLERRAEDLGAVLRANRALERQLHGCVGEKIPFQILELERLRRRLDGPPPLPPEAHPSFRRVEELEKALVEAEARVAALLDSMSWQLTSPLRRAYSLLAKRKDKA